MSLDKNIGELKDIVNKMENDNMSLDDSIKMYEKATDIAKGCLTHLKETKGKITILRKEIEELKEEKF